MALKVLMKLMYIARMARFDLLKPVGSLARLITRWGEDSDDALDKLIAYVRQTLDLKLIGYVGDAMNKVRLDMYSDADFAGMASQHSTTGGHLMLAGANTRFPLTAVSKKQQSVSTSTTEAELTAIFRMVRNVAVPAIDLWETLLGKMIPVNVYEDNQTVNHIIKTGKNQSMRHFERTHLSLIHI